jgi:Tfp pilus assembly protein PilV
MNSGFKKRGFVLHEALMAVAMAMALAVGIAQLLVVVAQQRRLARQYAVATREAGNLMEDLAARSWDDTTTKALKSLELSEAAANYLPEANLSVDVTQEEADIPRITVEIEWQIAPERAEESVRLVSWKFLAKEEGP